MPDQPARDAEPADPWRPELGPAPRVRSWPPDRRPRMRIRINGQWRQAVVLQRADWADGRTSYLLDVRLPMRGNPTTTAYYAASYWWDERAMRPVRA